MHIEQKNLWENVNHNVSSDMGKGIAAYQASCQESSSIFDEKKEKYEHLAAVSASGNINMADATYMNPNKEEKTSIVDEISEKEGSSPKQRANEVAVIANTTSKEDLKQMEEDGFSLLHADSHTIVTVTDKIKASLAKAGVDVSSFGDTLSKEQLEEITGNPAVVSQVAQILEGNDLPVTEANLDACMESLEQATSITDIGENEYVYLLRYGLEPTIQNMYMAEHNSGTMANEELPISDEDFFAMQPQIEKIVEEAGLLVDEESLSDSRWLLEHQIPLTAENLAYYKELKDFSKELKQGTYDYGKLADSMAKAISEGKRPVDARMITAKRKLEETRLAMTTEAAKVMEKTGVEVDTDALQAIVDELKEQEKNYYARLLSASDVRDEKESVGLSEKVEIMSKTLEFFEEMKSQPAAVVAQIEDTTTITEIHDKGEELRQQFKEANQRYETLMTAPRKDMGDSIQKAFRNVEDILKDLEIEPTEHSKRAVRILGYNSMPVDEQSVEQVKNLDEKMQRAFRNLTPSTTLEMIKRGKNPLDMTLDELNSVVEQIQEETGVEEEEKFSRFLWKCEQNKEISQEERSSYIGIYRLIAQVEKTDGAALGFLMNQGSEITMRNLLSAVRSTKKGKMDYTVDDDFGGVRAKSGTEKIDQQIAVGFQQNCLKDVLDELTPEKLQKAKQMDFESMTPEEFAEALKEMETSEAENQAEEAYRNEELQIYRQYAQSTKEIYTYLERYDIANSMANLMAASNLLRKPNQMMERLFRDDLYSKDSKELVQGLIEQVLDAFGESLENPEELADAQEKLADVAEHAMDTMIIDDRTTLDVRELRQMKNQFQICAKKAQEECYMIPIPTGDSVTGVTLKVVRGKEEKGWVDIIFENVKLGKVAASFHVKDEGVTGMIAVSDERTGQLIKSQQSLLASALSGGMPTPEAMDLKVAYISDLSLEHYEMQGLRREQKMKENGELGTDKTNKVQTARLYQLAERFIRSVSELMN